MARPPIACGGGAGLKCDTESNGCNPMKVLGIETSCDETGVAIYDTEVGLRAH